MVGRSLAPRTATDAGIDPSESEVVAYWDANRDILRSLAISGDAERSPTLSSAIAAYEGGKYVSAAEKFVQSVFETIVAYSYEDATLGGLRVI